MLLSVQENRARRVRDNKLNQSLTAEANGYDDSFSDTSAVTTNGAAENNC